MKQPVEKPKDLKTEKPEITTNDLDNAAELLLQQLPDNAGELVRILRTEYEMPLWQLFCGILLAMHLEGRLSAFTLDPAWRDGIRQRDLVCKKCKKPFTPIHINQLYCTDICGNKVEAEKLLARQKEVLTKDELSQKLRLEEVHRLLKLKRLTEVENDTDSNTLPGVPEPDIVILPNASLPNTSADWAETNAEATTTS